MWSGRTTDKITACLLPLLLSWSKPLTCFGCTCFLRLFARALSRLRKPQTFFDSKTLEHMAFQALSPGSTVRPLIALTSLTWTIPAAAHRPSKLQVGLGWGLQPLHEWFCGCPSWLGCWRGCSSHLACGVLLLLFLGSGFTWRLANF